jgi:hypothetical protein
MATISSPGNFKKKKFTELTLPSGEVVLAKRVGVDAFLKTGKIPNSLLPYMRGAMLGQSADFKAEDLTPELIADMATMFDIATQAAIVEPTVHDAPTDVEREEDKLYVDEIDEIDKQFIFQWCVGGPTDVAKFREQTEQQLAALQDVKGVVRPTKRTARAK